LASIFCQNVSPKVYQEVAGLNGLLFSVRIKFICSPLPPQVERTKTDVRQYLRATAPCRLFKLCGYDPHATDRHFPFTGLVADQMIKEATVLQERGIVRMCEDADLCVCKNKSANKVTLQISLNANPEWFLHQTAPCFAGNIVALKSATKISFCNQRLEHGVPNLLGEHMRKIVKCLHPLELRFVPGKFEHRLPTDFFVYVAQQQSVVSPMITIGRERSGRAPAQFEVQSKIADDFLREQTDEVRVSRKSRIVIGEDFLGGGRTADITVLFQNQNTQTCPSKVACCHEAIVSGPQDYNVVLRFHVPLRAGSIVGLNIAN